MKVKEIRKKVIAKPIHFDHRKIDSMILDLQRLKSRGGQPERIESKLSTKAMLESITNKQTINSIRKLKDPDPCKRREHVELLGKFGDSNCLPFIISKFNDENGIVRKYATEAAGMIMRRQKRVISILGDILLNDNRWLLRQNAALALGISKSRKAVEYLVNAINDPAPSVRSDVLRALGLLKDKSVIKELETMNEYETDSDIKKEIKKTIKAIED